MSGLASAILEACRRCLPSGAAPLHEPTFGGNEREYLRECIDSGWVSSLGGFVSRFERELETFTGARHVIATVNGTAALHLCVRLASVAAGDEVLLPSLTFVATANAVSYCGAMPHFVDCDARTLGVDADKLEAHLNQVAIMRDGACFNRVSGRCIRALIVMHTFGNPAELDALTALCQRFALILIEDAAQALGSRYRGRHTGNGGLVAALSFNGNKIVTTGGGGAILTGDNALATRARHLATTARVASGGLTFFHDEIGYNYRMPSLNAALGCAQLEQLPTLLLQKKHLAARYRAAFDSVAGVTFFTSPECADSNHWLNTLLLDDDLAGRRDAVLELLNSNGYGARPIWTLMHRLPMYRDCPRMDLTTAENLERRVINLPSSAHLAAPATLV